MKNLILILSLFLLQPISAQDVQKELDIPKGYVVSNYEFTDNGSFYMTTTKGAKAKGATFSKFNAHTLEVELTHKPEGPFRIIKSSPNGETFYYDNYKPLKAFSIVPKKASGTLQIDGSIKNFKEKDWTPDDFVLISDFINKDFYVAIGYEKGREKFKGKKENKDYKLFRRDLKTFQSSYIKFNLTREIEIDEEEKFEFQFLNHNNENFTFITKNYSQKDDKGNHPKSVDYVLSIYNYEGKLLETRTLTNEIEDKQLNFKSIDMGPGSFAYESDIYTSVNGSIKSSTDAIPQHISFGNVYHDRAKQVYYTYGIINGGNNTKNKCVLMLDKFNYNGDKIWSKTYDQPTRKKKGQGFENYVTKVKLVDAGSNLGITLADMGNDYLSVIQVDKENGEVLSSNGYGNFGGRTTYSLGPMNFNNRSKESFLAEYVFKERFGKKIRLDFNTLIAYSLNNEFKNLIDSKKNTERELNIITNITKNGVVAIMAYNKDNDFKFLKFNWKQENNPEGNTK